MRVYDAKNLKHYDRLAEKRHRVFILKTLFFAGLAIAIAGLVLYLLFFSRTLDIRDISIKGLGKVSNDAFSKKLSERMNYSWFGHVEYQKNILFFNSDAFRAEALAAFPEIKSISINKKLPHSLSVDIIERKTAGVWCFMFGCRYFDEEGNMWGEAARSSGFLILNVDDMRSGVRSIDPDLLSNIMLISEQLKKMNIFVNKLRIPDNFIGDFRAHTSNGYELIFNTDSDIEGQLKILRILLEDRQKESDFRPQYIDLRINGRIYYK